MKIVTLMENSSARKDLGCEHGLSLYIETGGHRILFDAGQTGAFADNAEKLGIDLRKVDFAVLSHGHYDHGGGLTRFLEINRTAPVYLRKEAFGQHFNASTKYIGLDQTLIGRDRLVFVDEDREIAEGIRLVSCDDRLPVHQIESYGLQVMENQELKPDDFCHEQYLTVREKGKTICFSGCSHKGILNIMHWLRPDVLLGGFHFVKLDPHGDGATVLTAAAKELLSYPTVYYTGHCTGKEQSEFLKIYMGQRLHDLSSGIQVEI